MNDLFNPKIFDLKAMGVIQLIDERELHFIPLLYHQAGWQPDLGAVEDHVNQGELLRFSRCCISGAKHQYGEKHNEPAEVSAPPMGLSHGDFSFASTRTPACEAPTSSEGKPFSLEEVCQQLAMHRQRHAGQCPQPAHAPRPA